MQKSNSKSYEEILAFKPICKIADYSQLNGDLSRKPKQMNGDLRYKCIYTNGDLRYTRFGRTN